MPYMNRPTETPDACENCDRVARLTLIPTWNYWACDECREEAESAKLCPPAVAERLAMLAAAGLTLEELMATDASFRASRARSLDRSTHKDLEFPEVA
jgi:hypothetical protein